MPWGAAGQSWEVDKAWEEDQAWVADQIWEVDQLVWEVEQLVWEEGGQGVLGSPFTAAVCHKHKLSAGK